MAVDVIVDDDILFSFIITVQSPSILFHYTLPRDGCSKKQGVKTWKIKSLSNQLSGCDQDETLFGIDLKQFSPECFLLFFFIVPMNRNT